MGGLYLNIREYTKAIAEHKKVIELDPDNLIAHLYLGIIFAEEKRYDKSEETFKKMLKINPDNIMGIYYYDGKMLEKNKRFEDAEKMFKKAISLSPYFEMALFDLAALYEKQDKLDNAIEVYRTYLENNPARISLRVRMQSF